MRCVALLVGVCACSQWYGLDQPVRGDVPNTTIDATDATEVDTFVTAPDAGNCWSIPQLGVSFCRDQPLSGTLSVASDALTDTTADGTGVTACTPTTDANLCVIAADSITVAQGKRWRFKGTRPVILVANAVSVLGELDASSSHGGDTGPGAAMPGCDDGTAPTGKGGGQGGSFGEKGGDGGDQANNANTRGVAGALLTGMTFRGGCRGTDGGGATNGNAAAGGAIALIANTISVGSGAIINASGASGDGGNGPDDGGGGGGSGGMIVLESPMIITANNSQIFANGGHGGGGANSSGPGVDGTDSTGATNTGGGGGGNGTAGDGAPGYPSTTRNGTNGNGTNDGGGGGGGGAGVIHVYLGTVSGGLVSPPPS
ncbi:MAG TPA: hypothetical protein VL326_17865 [Kofleriaceae bacterium]|nr:hypothetical protein [Kofleriaceae bacterium]